MSNHFIVFTDGSCLKNGQPGAKAGYAVIVAQGADCGEFSFAAPLIGPVQTNNRAEFTAVLEALRVANRIDPSRKKTMCLYTDCQLLIKSLTMWLPQWIANGWRKSNGAALVNADLLEDINKLLKQRQVSFSFVKAHTKFPGSAREAREPELLETPTFFPNKVGVSTFLTVRIYMTVLTYIYISDILY